MPWQPGKAACHPRPEPSCWTSWVCRARGRRSHHTCSCCLWEGLLVRNPELFQANPTQAETCRDHVGSPSHVLEGLFQMNSNDLSGILLEAKPCRSKVWDALGGSAEQIAVEGR